MDALNSFDDNISFTYESEQNGKLDYLDVTLHHLDTTYHKPMASSRLLNYYSNHPMKMKQNVAEGFIRKIFRISHSNFWKSNIERKRTFWEKTAIQ